MDKLPCRVTQDLSWYDKLQDDAEKNFELPDFAEKSVCREIVSEELAGPLSEVMECFQMGLAIKHEELLKSLKKLELAMLCKYRDEL